MINLIRYSINGLDLIYFFYYVQDLKNIFDNLKDKITSIHSDVGNTWFITFADEDTTTDAFLLSRGKQFQGKSVQARVKSENLLKSV